MAAERLDRPDYARRLTDSLREEIEAQLANPIWIHGRRIQNMFEAMVVAFDCYTLIKTEDAGSLYPEDAYSLPDFRIVLKDRTQIFVEVKNVWCQDPCRQHFEMRASDLEKKVRYADTVGTPLKLAIYWARWGMWTLLDPQRLRNDGNSKCVDMVEAAPFNEMACLGDVSIATRAPLTIRFEADRTKARCVTEDNKVAMTIGAVQVLCEDTILTGLDRNLALLLIEFGQWHGKEGVAMTSGDLVDSIDFDFVPEETSDQGFDFVGDASRMFARYYSLRTVDEGRVVRVGFDLEPGLFRVLTVGDDTGHSIPLWRFHFGTAIKEC